MQTNYVPKALWDHDDSFIRGVDRWQTCTHSTLYISREMQCLDLDPFSL